MKTGQVRVSSTEQKEEGQQIAFYVDELIRNGVPESNIVIELARSGSFNEDKDLEVYYKDGKLLIEFDIGKKRPELNKFIKKLIELYEKYKKGIITKEETITELYTPQWSRFVRNVIVQEALVILLNKNECKVLTTRDTNDSQGRMIMGVLNHIESDNTKKRVDMNKEFKFRHGLYLGTEDLYGYKKTKLLIDGREFTHLVPDDATKQVILDIFSSKDRKDVCKQYNLSPTTYYSIKRNKFYCGFISYKGVEKKGKHEPLVTEEQFQKFQ